MRRVLYLYVAISGRDGWSGVGGCMAVLGVVSVGGYITFSSPIGFKHKTCIFTHKKDIQT